MLVYRLLCIASSVDGHLGWFHYSAVMNNAKMSMYKFYIGSLVVFCEHSHASVSVNMFSVFLVTYPRGVARSPTHILSLALELYNPPHTL